MINILAVDDEEDMSALYKAFFKKEQKAELVNLDCVKSGRECLDYLNGEDKGRVHIVLCDINMPGVDGFDLLCEIKKFSKNIKVFMVSAYDNDQYHEKALRLGSENYLTKPINFPHLKNIIQQYYPNYQVN